MAKYLLLYSGGSMPEAEADQATFMQAWSDWYGRLGSAVADTGNPFTPAAKTISSDGIVSDNEADSMASGYSIVSADSLDDAVEMTKDCPVLQSGANVTVYETFNVM